MIVIQSDYHFAILIISIIITIIITKMIPEHSSIPWPQPASAVTKPRFPAICRVKKHGANRRPSNFNKAWPSGKD